MKIHVYILYVCVCVRVFYKSLKKKTVMVLVHWTPLSSQKLIKCYTQPLKQAVISLVNQEMVHLTVFTTVFPVKL